MIPENVPAVSYVGNNASTRFDFDFLVEDSAKLIVELTTTLGEIVPLTYGTDYSVNEFNNSQGGYITYPLQSSSHSVLAPNEKISLYLTLPAEQINEYSKSSEMDFKLLEYSLDYLTRLIQILRVDINQCARLPIGSKETVQELINQLAYGNTLAQKWAEFMDGTVDGSGYSAKYHANEAAIIASSFVQQGGEIIARAEEQANIAEAYAERAVFGMQWTQFRIANWTVAADGVHYELTIQDLPIINGVYEGTWDNKKVVSGVDVVITGNGCKLISLNAFDGFILSAASVIGNYVHTQDIASNTWVINHNLGHIPTIIPLDNDNVEITCTKEHPSFNKSIIHFENAETGTAYLR